MFLEGDYSIREEAFSESGGSGVDGPTAHAVLVTVQTGGYRNVYCSR